MTLVNPISSLGQTGSTVDPLINRTVEGKYHLDAKLGAGGMGTVYRARRLLIGDEVAIKILHPGNVSESQASERFRREAQAAARLKHPNAVTIYDFGVTDDGLLYLVMELVEGQSLRQIIKTQGPLTPSTAAEVISQVCAVLDEAHRQQIIHRDIKPDNIMVSIVSSGLRVKVLDFGIAKLRDVTASNLTQAGSVVGTPHYMSPEQCLGKDLDFRSDIYSLGIVLYEILAGVVPFNSPTSTAVVVQHVNQPPPSLRAMNLSVPEDVERVVLHALEKAPELRPQTAGQLARELTEAVNPWQGGKLNSEARAAASLKRETLIPSGTTSPSGFTPTVVLPNASRSFSTGAAVGSDHEDGRARKALIAIGVLAAVLVGVVVFLLLRGESKSHEASESASSSAAPAQTRTPPALQPQPAANPNGVLRHAFCKYAGVNIRALPGRNETLIATIGSGEELLVFKESPNFDTVVIQSEHKAVTDNWSEVELVKNPSVHGWVFNGFITKN
jgi:serine/threonine protein kinase